MRGVGSFFSVATTTPLVADAEARPGQCQLARVVSRGDEC